MKIPSQPLSLFFLCLEQFESDQTVHAGFAFGELVKKLFGFAKDGTNRRRIPYGATKIVDHIVKAARQNAEFILQFKMDRLA
ncbi:hypothetical protein D3C76_730610 [compost metagenome]